MLAIRIDTIKVVEFPVIKLFYWLVLLMDIHVYT